MSAPLPLLDLERFNKVGVRSDPIVLKIFRRFLEHLPSAIEEIRGAHDAGDWESFRQRVHRLKGASLTCCFTGLADHLSGWEDAAEDLGDIDFSRMTELALNSSEAMERLLQP